MHLMIHQPDILQNGMGGKGMAHLIELARQSERVVVFFLIEEGER